METLRKRWDAGKWGRMQIGIYMTEADRDGAYDDEAKEYCSNISRDCNTCSLVNYGMDCHNNSL